ncbi:MAG: reductive dehalogenase [Candidatus Latescibacteria bacterium]|nr:reductive dehalogenase [Candidatus Latescibacterota bacterium]
MSEESVDRRNFLQLIGLGAGALGAGLAAPAVVAETENGFLVESESEYGGFLVEKLKEGKYPYECDPAVLKRMSEKYNIFSRNGWDPVRLNRPERRLNLTYENLVNGRGVLQNQTRLDYALMAAAWKYANMGGPGGAYGWELGPSQVTGAGLDSMGAWDPADLDMTWGEASLTVKHAALFYGASLAGIAELNPLWIYADHYSPVRADRERVIPVYVEGDRCERAGDAWYIPGSMNRVISLAFEEDYFAIANSPGRLASAATGNGYSRMAVTASTLSDFIRALGYRAIPAGNGLGLSIPIAVDAGLGQIGRLGLLMTPKYGPRVRLAKVITDMPLVPDSPIDFGVTQFCEACMVCAEQCPSGAITDGPRTWEGRSPSNNPGVLKWHVEVEKCYDFNGFSCSNCKRCCPFNKPNNSWLHRMIRQVIKGRIKPLDGVMVAFDRASGYGRQLEDAEFWKMDGQKSITARESM